MRFSPLVCISCLQEVTGTETPPFKLCMLIIYKADDGVKRRKQKACEWRVPLRTLFVCVAIVDTFHQLRTFDQSDFVDILYSILPAIIVFCLKQRNMFTNE